MKNYQEFYSNILDNISSGVYFVDAERTITYWNKGAERLSGYTAEEVVGKKCSGFLNHVDENGKVLCGDGCPLLGTIIDGNPRQAEVYMLHKLGQRVPVLVQAMPMKEDEQTLGAVEIFHDISPLKFAQARIRELTDVAFLDKLTQVYNRAGLEKITDTWFKDFKAYNYSFGIIFIDVDKFKQVNEAYQVLSNPDKRAQYDRFGRVSGNGGMPTGEPNFGGFEFNFGGGGFGDIFESFRAGHSGNPPRPSRARRQARPKGRG